MGTIFEQPLVRVENLVVTLANLRARECAAWRRIRVRVRKSCHTRTCGAIAVWSSARKGRV